MVVLHVSKACQSCRWAREELEGLGVQSQVLEDSPTPLDIPPHAMADDDQLFLGHQQIAGHLEEMRRSVAEWTSFQSDTCYCSETADIESTGCRPW